jgi:RNA polymerase sigma factor (sigma-70 family)
MNRLLKFATRIAADVRSDRDLLEAFAASRDSDAMAELFRRYAPVVRRAAGDVCPAAADEVVQSAFLLLANRAGTLSSRASAAGWLFHVARRLAMKARTTAARRARHEARVPPPAGPAPVLDDLAFREVRALVAEELDQLPERLRAPLVLHYWEGAGHAEAAARLGCSVSTLKRILDAGREQLGARLARRGLNGASVLVVLAAIQARATAGAALSVPAFATFSRGVGGFGVGKGLALFTCVFVAGAALALGLATHEAAPPADAAVLGEKQPIALASLRAAPVPKMVDPGEGRIVLWRDGRPVSIAPGTKDVSPLLGSEFEGRAGRIRVGPDGKQLLVYLANRDGILPSTPEKRDRVFILDNRSKTEIDSGVSPCHAFWGSNGAIYGYGLVPPKGAVPDPGVDLTKNIVNWSLDLQTGKTNRLKLPGDVTVLDVSRDGSSFLVLQYEKNPASPGVWPDYRLGVIPADGSQLVPLTKLGEFSPQEYRFSPNGGSVLGIVYRSEGPEGRLIPDLVVFDVKTKSRTVVDVPKDARVAASCWSPDGKRIAFVWETQSEFSERNRVLPGPLLPGHQAKPKYTVTISKPDGSAARDVYTEVEHPYGSIDWGR